MKSFSVEKLTREFRRTLSDERQRCILCGRDVFDNKEGICPTCASQFTYNGKKTCQKCGSALSGEADFCGHCSYTEAFFDRAYSVFVYEKAIVEIIHKVKFGKKGALCESLAQLLVTKALLNGIDFDVVAFVPMTAKEKKRRGFNQSELLAQFFCDILALPFEKDILVKTKDNSVQSELAYKQRQDNVRGCFTVVNKDAVTGKKILLIDDVRTTGATTNECGRVLKKAKADKVYVLTLASVGYKLDFE